MPYTVLAISHADRGEYDIGTFDTPVVAIAVVKMRVDRELAHMLEQGVKATELHEMWAAFGTGYAIAGHGKDSHAILTHRPQTVLEGTFTSGTSVRAPANRAT